MLFPVATHSYFRALNKAQQKRRFLAAESTNPVFTYPAHFSLQALVDIHQKVGSDEVLVRRFALIESAARLQTDASEIDTFRDRNVELFSEPQRDLAEAIVVRHTATLRGEDAVLWNEVKEMVGGTIGDGTTVEPDQETFRRYRGYLKQYTSMPESGQDVVHAIQSQLDSTGLSKKAGDYGFLKVMSTLIRIIMRKQFLWVVHIHRARLCRSDE